MKFLKTLEISNDDVIIALLAITISWFNWDIIDLLTVFFGPLVIGAWLIIFVILLIKAIVKVIKNRNKPAFSTLGLYIIVILFHFLISTTGNKIEINFYLNYYRREQVIKDLNAGKTFSPASHNWCLQKLPIKYFGLSKGGNEIFIRDNSVLFYTFRGILDNYSGFVYMKDGQVPPDDYNGSTVIEKKHFRGNWWWVSAT